MFSGFPSAASALRLAGFRAGFCLSLVLASLLPANAQYAPVTTLHAFTGVGSDGAQPQAPLIFATDYYLYGTTGYTVFRITWDGAQMTPLGTLSGGPGTGLIEGSDRNFYGTSYGGGTNNTGAIFELASDGTLTTLYSFSALNGTPPTGTNGDGINPAGLVQANDGNFYGTAEYGGSYGAGTVFKLTPGGVFTTLHDFSGGAGDGAVPLTPLIVGADGDLYGTTYLGGADNDGIVFKISTSGDFTLVHSFEETDGSGPHGPLLLASDGNYYGTTQIGGKYAEGTVFRLTPGGTLTTIHSFSSVASTYANKDGAQPVAGLTQAPSDGFLYGTTYYGGVNGKGTIFRVTLSGKFSTLYAFTATNGNPPMNVEGAGPYAGLVEGPADYLSAYLYGTTVQGGGMGLGTVYRFKLAPFLTGIAPSSADAGGPDLTVVLHGKGFAESSVAEWFVGTTTTPLTTRYVSPTELKATIPAALITSPGKADLFVTTSEDGSSGGKTFTILLTSLQLLSANLSRNSTTGVITANLTWKNAGYQNANNVSITKATLGSAKTTTPLPASAGNIAVGATGSVTLSFPGSAGASGQVVTLKAAGTFTGGTFTDTLKVTLP